MAVPKRKTGKTRQRKRRSQCVKLFNRKMSKKQIAICKNCNTVIPSHCICPKCGFFKDKQILNLN